MRHAIDDRQSHGDKPTELGEKSIHVTLHWVQLLDHSVRVLEYLDIKPTLTFRLGFAQKTQHLCVGGVLAQGPQHVPTLPIGDLHLSSWSPVKQRKGLFELCRETRSYGLLPREKAAAAACSLE